MTIYLAEAGGSSALSYVGWIIPILVAIGIILYIAFRYTRK